MSLVNMKDLLDQAKREDKGCGAFNVGNMEMVRGVIRAAEDEETPIIIQIAEENLECSPLELMGPMMINTAMNASVDVAVHLDGGKSIENIKEALELGFTSVMYDGSSKSYETNVSETKAVVKLAKEYGAAVEGQMGIVGKSDDIPDGRHKLTRPGAASQFVRDTGVDALAVAIGNLYGEYRSAPAINYEILDKIHDNVDIPLVLHGGTGLPSDELAKLVRHGIRKVNFGTANYNALSKAAEKYEQLTLLPNFSGLNMAMTNGVCENVRKYIKSLQGNNRDVTSC